MTQVKTPPAAYWRAETGGSVSCGLCPHQCRIAEGRAGVCGVRRCESGALGLPYYGLVSSLSMDPIEKKPLHHFLPGSEVFSAGFVGCNMRCPFCQNWQISQELPVSSVFHARDASYSPESLVSAGSSIRRSLHRLHLLGDPPYISNSSSHPWPKRELRASRTSS